MGDFFPVPTITAGATVDLSPLEGALVGALAAVVEYTSQAVIYSATEEQALGQYTFGLFGGVFGRVAGVIDSIRAWLYGHIIGPLLARLQALTALLHRIFDPILRVIRQIRAIQDYYFKTVIQPILNFIQRLRAALLLFRILHFKWATQLDQQLAGLESRLAKVAIDARARLNQLSDLIELVIDPAGAIRSSAYLAAAARDIGALWSLLAVFETPSLGAQDIQNANDAVRAADKGPVLAFIHSTVRTGLDADTQQMLTQIHGVIKAGGY